MTTACSDTFLVSQLCHCNQKKLYLSKLRPHDMLVWFDYIHAYTQYVFLLSLAVSRSSSVSSLLSCLSIGGSITIEHMYFYDWFICCVALNHSVGRGRHSAGWLIPFMDANSFLYFLSAVYLEPPLSLCPFSLVCLSNTNTIFNTFPVHRCIQVRTYRLNKCQQWRRGEDVCYVPAHAHDDFVVQGSVCIWCNKWFNDCNYLVCFKRHNFQFIIPNTKISGTWSVKGYFLQFGLTERRNLTWCIRTLTLSEAPRRSAAHLLGRAELR